MTEFIALGENCLPDDVLSSLNKKGETYPFGNGRFNIEYLTEIIRTDFVDLMAEHYLVKGKFEGKEVVRNKLYKHKHDIYSPCVANQFEFTHHNVFEEAPRRSINRKIQRFKEVLKAKRDVVFVYHYKHSDKINPEKMVELLDGFLLILKKKYGRRFKCLLWYQHPASETRKVVLRKERNILVGEFFTSETWDGDAAWNAPNDRDLFTDFFEHQQLKKYIHGVQYQLNFGTGRNSQRAV